MQQLTRSGDPAHKSEILERTEGLKQAILTSMLGDQRLTQTLEQILDEVPNRQTPGKSADALQVPELAGASTCRNAVDAPLSTELPLVMREAAEDLAVGGPGEAQRPLGEARQPSAHGDTTLLVRNIPWDVTQEELVSQWPIDGSYNFLFLPYSEFLGRHVGTAIINFVSPEHAARFNAQWAGQKLGRHEYKKVLSVAMAETQGRDENLKRVKEDAVVLPIVLVGGKLFERHGILQLVHLAKAEIFGR